MNREPGSSRPHTTANPGDRKPAPPTGDGPPPVKWYRAYKKKYEHLVNAEKKKHVMRINGYDVPRVSVADLPPYKPAPHSERFVSGTYAVKDKVNPTMNMAYNDPQPKPTGQQATVERLQRWREIKKLQFEDWRSQHNMKTRVWIKQLPGNENRESNAKYGFWNGLTVCVGTAEEEKLKRGMLKDPPEVVSRKVIRRLAEKYHEIKDVVDYGIDEDKEEFKVLHQVHRVDPDLVTRPPIPPSPPSTAPSTVSRRSRAERKHAELKMDTYAPPLFSSQYKTVHSAQDPTFYRFGNLDRSNYYRRNPEIGPANQQRVRKSYCLSE